MSDSEKQYSLYEEELYTNNIKDVIREGWDTHWEKVCPFELEIYEGEEVQFKASHFLPTMEDYICEQESDKLRHIKYSEVKSVEVFE